MGLDQIWFTEEKLHDTFYEHRKIPALQEFMEKEYYLQGGTAKVFNCVDVVITIELLDKLQEALKNEGEGLDKEASGFFWGSHYDEDLPEIEEAIFEARTKIVKGENVKYSSWW